MGKDGSAVRYDRGGKGDNVTVITQQPLRGNKDKSKIIKKVYWDDDLIKGFKYKSKIRPTTVSSNN